MVPGVVCQDPQREYQPNSTPRIKKNAVSAPSSVEDGGRTYSISVSIVSFSIVYRLNNDLRRC